ncbi:MAG: SDR family NAD(P)-dependent oxidoreductase [Candidatus Acidoferrales bacterium]
MSSGDLSGKVALVTGGSGGIGRALLRAFRAAGARGVSLDLAAAGDETPWVKCDVTSDESVAAAVQQVFELHRRLDIVVHAAGVTRDAVLWKLPVSDWDLVHNVNLRGAFLLLRHAIPLLRRGKGGRVVLVGSINASRGKFGLTAYASSKAGLVGLARSVARETARFGILVNVVEPGMVRTPMTDALPEEVRKEAVAESLLGRLLEPAEVAAAVLFLCGPAGAALTGQILRVDAGQYLGG